MLNSCFINASHSNVLSNRFAFFSCQNQFFEDRFLNAWPSWPYIFSFRFSLVKHIFSHTAHPSAISIRSWIIPVQITSFNSRWFDICFSHQKVFVVLQLLCFISVQMYISFPQRGFQFCQILLVFRWVFLFVSLTWHFNSCVHPSMLNMKYSFRFCNNTQLPLL